VLYPDRLNPAGEASQSLTANPTQRSRAGVYPAFSFDIQAFGLCLAFGFWHLNFICYLDSVIRTWFVIWALAFELHLAFASLRHSADLHGPQT
jgi:hypothetical protein